MTGWIDIAVAITEEDRPRDYGHPLTNFLRIALHDNIKDAGRRAKGDYITPLDVAERNIGQKLARQYNSHKDDNYIDIMGYSACVDVINQRMIALGYEEGVQAFRKMNLQCLFDLLIRSMELDRLSESAA